MDCRKGPTADEVPRVQVEVEVIYVGLVCANILSQRRRPIVGDAVAAEDVVGPVPGLVFDHTCIILLSVNQDSTLTACPASDRRLAGGIAEVVAAADLLTPGGLPSVVPAPFIRFLGVGVRVRTCAPTAVHINDPDFLIPAGIELMDLLTEGKRFGVRRLGDHR